MECLPYRLKLDSSGRITLRNRRHIRSLYRGVPKVATSPTLQVSQTLTGSMSSFTNSSEDSHGTVESGSGSRIDSVEAPLQQRRKTTARIVYDADTGSYVDPRAVPEDI